MLCSTIIDGVITILAAIGAVAIGVRVYFRQREFELVQLRYLEGGIDAVVANSAEQLNNFHSNWARCLQLLKQFRDNPAFDGAELDQGFARLSSDRWAMIAQYRVNALIDDVVVWQAFQILAAFADRGCNIAMLEIPEAIRAHLGESDDARAGLCAAWLQRLEDLDKESHRHHVFIERMQKIASTFENERFSFRKIETFKTKPAVVQAIAEIRAAYQEEIEAKTTAEQVDATDN